MNGIAPRASRDTILAWLGQVMDPEVPVVSIVDIGTLRDVQWVNALENSVVVTVTPTYSGCAACARYCPSCSPHATCSGLDNRLDDR